MSRSAAVRSSLAALVIVVALIVAIWPRERADVPSSSYEDFLNSRAGSTVSAGPVPNATLDPLRAAAGLRPCPSPATGTPATGPLAGLIVDCLADGSPVDLGAALAGKPALINLWAHWCAPCATELPVLDRFAERAGAALTVVTVHEDPRTDAALTRLSDYGVRLAGVQDRSTSVAAAVGAPAVLPVSILVRADGSVAKVLAQPFESEDQIAAAVEQNLGVRV